MEATAKGRDFGGGERRGGELEVLCGAGDGEEAVARTDGEQGHRSVPVADHGGTAGDGEARNGGDHNLAAPLCVRACQGTRKGACTVRGLCGVAEARRHAQRRPWRTAVGFRNCSGEIGSETGK